MIELRTLGTLELRDTADGGNYEALLSRSKLVALLVYLALARPLGSHRRQTLLGLFWPESGEEQARRSLSQALYELRRQLGPGVIVSNGNGVAIDPERLWCDAEAFEDALEEGRPAAALALYKGDLLNGFSLSGCGEFELWLSERRETLRSKALRAAKTLAGNLASNGDPVEAVHWLRTALRWEPYDEELLARLLVVLGRLGDRTGAVREYEAFSARLREDLEIEPSDEVRRLVDEIGNAPENGPIVLDEPHELLASAPSIQAGRASRPGHLVVALSVVALAISAVALWMILSSPGEAPTAAELDPRHVLVGEFENRTGDPRLEPLGPTLGDRMAEDLGRTGMMRPVRPSLLGTGRAENDRSLSNRDLARELGAGTLIRGALERRGDSLALIAWIVDTEGGEIVRTVEIRAPTEDPSETTSREFRSRVLGTVAMLLDPRIEGWARLASAPPSHEAYLSFADALIRFFDAQDANYDVHAIREAADRLVEAGSIDSTFTTPLVWAVVANRSCGRWPQADSLIAELKPRLDALPPWDRTLLESEIAEDPRQRYRALERLVDLAPDSEWVYRLATAAGNLNRAREALDLIESLDPNEGSLSYDPNYWYTLVLTRHQVGDHEGAWRDAVRMEERHPEVARYLQARALVGLDPDRALRAVQEYLGPPGPWNQAAPWPDMTYRTLVQELLVHGHDDVARRALRDYFERWEAHRPEGPRVPVADLHEMAGHPVFALRELAKIPDSVGYRPAIDGHRGLLHAILGNRAAARRIERRLEGLDDGTAEQPYAVRIWRVRILAHLGETKRALDLLEDWFERDGFYFVWHYDHQLEPLRDHARFEALMRPRG